jgi:hypothetical protein
MSVHVLMAMNSQDFVHVPLFDLQSFFFVFVWICIGYAGPKRPLIQSPEVLRSWVNDNHSTAAATKSGQVIMPDIFITPHFTLYFRDLAPFATKFCEAVLFQASVADDIKYWRTNVAPHKKVIDLFNEELQRLRREEAESKLMQPQGFSLQEPKLRRSPRDNTSTRAKVQANLGVRGASSKSREIMH